MKFWLIVLLAIVADSPLGDPSMAQSGPQSTPVYGGAGHIVLPPGLQQLMLASNRSYKLSKAGNDFAKQGDWQNAQDCYQQALDQYPTNPDALYGMAECSRVAGDTNAEIGFYRKVVYSTNPADKGFGETNPERLMKFALLLSQAGYADEALAVYHHAVPLINYMDGKQNIPVLLPAFGLAPGQVPYTPRCLQALAHAGIAIKTQDREAEAAHLEEAIRLQPNLGLAYFYKAKTIAGRAGHLREARDAFRAAALYGDAGTRAAVDKMMKDYAVEGNAQAEQDLEAQHKKQAAQKK